MKMCTKCGETKELHEFTFSKRDGNYAQPCKQCRCDYARKRRKDPAVRQREIDYYQANKERQAQQKKRYYAEKKELINERNKEYQRRLREQVFAHYGDKCACCGEYEKIFLCIDHIDGGGRKHRREWGTSTLAAWLVKHGFPDGFQILCWNCNSAKHYLGQCPHQQITA